MKKRILALLMVALLVMNVGVAFAGNYEEGIKEYRVDEVEKQVEALVNMGLIQGDDNGDLLLDNELIRVEGALVFSRLYAMEQAGYEYFEEHGGRGSKFSDVPGWVGGVIDYLNKVGVVKGISENEFGAFDLMTAEQFTTMVLRGMGYDDKAGEFVWSESLDKALEIGMLTEETKAKIEQDDSFTREEMMIISYNALFTPTKSGKLVLQDRQQLYDESITKVVTLELTEEELEEILKLEYNSEDSPFGKDFERTKELYIKFEGYVQNIYDLVTVNVDGEAYELEVGRIHNVTQGRDQGIYAMFSSTDGSELKLRYNENTNVVYMGQDASLLSHVAQKVIPGIALEQFGVDDVDMEFEGTSENTVRKVKVMNGSSVLFNAIIEINHNNIEMNISTK